jgi:hypothetical protein
MKLFTIVILIIVLSGSAVFSQAKQKNKIPCARSGYALAYDANRNIVVLFGGQDSVSMKLGDTWEWSNGNWTEMDIKEPSPRINAAMAYDLDKKRIVLFGGLTTSGIDNDLWTYDGKQWVKINSSSSPSPRQLATMVFDKSKSQFVLFGGWDAKKNVLGDTWVLKNNQWTQLAIKGPTPRASHAMTYNDDHQSVFVYGGYDTTSLNDLWELKDGIWNNINVKDAPSRLHASMSYDPDKRRILVFGGFDDEGRTNILLEYLNQEWSVIRTGKDDIPDPRAEHRSVFIPGQGLFIFGGVIGSDPNTRNRSNDTWLYNEGLWHKLSK